MTTDIPTKPYNKHPQYITCKNCYTTTRVEFTGPSTAGGFMQYCPACGSDKLNDVALNSDDDYWYEIAKGFGLPNSHASVLLMKRLYEMWDVTHYRLFREYVEHEAGPLLEKIRATNA